MHNNGHIITKKIPTDEQISRILEKYRYNFIVDDKFDDKVKSIDLKGKFITVIDFHS